MKFEIKQTIFKNTQFEGDIISMFEEECDEKVYVYIVYKTIGKKYIYENHCKIFFQEDGFFTRDHRLMIFESAEGFVNFMAAQSYDDIDFEISLQEAAQNDEDVNAAYKNYIQIID